MIQTARQSTSPICEKKYRILVVGGRIKPDGGSCRDNKYYSLLGPCNFRNLYSIPLIRHVIGIQVRVFCILLDYILYWYHSLILSVLLCLKNHIFQFYHDPRFNKCIIGLTIHQGKVVFCYPFTLLCTIFHYWFDW